MCLAAECDRRAVTATRGHLGQPGAGGADRLVGRRCRCCGHGGGCVADAPLLSPSGRHLLVLISHLKLRELTCLEFFFVEKYFLKVVIILLWENNCLFNLFLNNLEFCWSRII
jgi:hypothetical protein